MFQLPVIGICYATALRIQTLSAGRNIPPHRNWPALGSQQNLTPSKLFYNYCSPCHLCDSNPFAQYWIFITPVTGDQLHPFLECFTPRAHAPLSITNCMGLKLQFIPLLDCDLYLGSRCNLFFNCINILPSSPELIKKQIIFLLYPCTSSSTSTSTWSPLDFYEDILCHV